MSQLKEYYILSLKHTHDRDHVLTWWRPDNKGYTWYLTGAGKYTQDDIDANPEYYNDRERTMAVPCDTVDRFVEEYMCAPKEGPAVQWLNGESTWRENESENITG